MAISQRGQPPHQQNSRDFREYAYLAGRGRKAAARALEESLSGSEHDVCASGEERETGLDWMRGGGGVGKLREVLRILNVSASSAGRRSYG